MDCELILQIFTGGFSGDTVSYEAVEKKLLSVLPDLPVRKVIMGWAPDVIRSHRSVYEKTAAFLAKRNIEFFLWFPVFSETGVARDQSPLVDLYGRRLENSRDQAGEDFAFCCPNDPRNIENIFDIFEREFSSIPFTGIFLDKIRYPSFAQGHGQRGVFSCFCPRCQAKYERENFDPRQLQKALSRPASSPLGITAYRGSGVYTFEDPAVSDFFSLKAAFIFQGMQQICQYFREKGFKIGFDVFAPFLSPFVGQDLASLSRLCDFMKPMMYRITQAPAGLPFELEALLAETDGEYAIKKQIFYELLGLDPHKNMFDLAFAVKETSGFISSSACPVYPGVEINRKKNMAEVYPDYIEETLRAYTAAGINNFVLSWDLLSAPEENLDRICELVGNRGTIG